MKFVSKTFHGLEEVLANELNNIGAKSIEKAHRAVMYEGEEDMMYRANLSLRTALNVLVPLAEFDIENQNDYYQRLRDIPWENHFLVRKTFAIDATANSDIFAHSHFLALRTKDAIADRFKDLTGRRPNVDTEDPHVKINVHINEKHCTISIDSSGAPLFKRGYRKFHGKASLNESLAAGIVLLSGWDGTTELIDPFCGTGTILIEAALIAANIRPGTYREKFAFENWKNFNRKIYEEVQDEDDQKSLDVPILGVDIEPKQIGQAKANIENAFLNKYISVQRGDFSTIQGDSEKGMIITNPPYDKRVKIDEINHLYRRFGDHLKNEFTGYEAWLLSGNMNALKNIGLKTSSRIELFNGPIESRLCCYKMY